MSRRIYLLPSAIAALFFIFLVGSQLVRVGAARGIDFIVYLPYLTHISDAIVTPTPTVTLIPTVTPPAAGAWGEHENPTPAFNNAERTSNARWVFCAEQGEVCDIDAGYLIAYGDESTIGETPLPLFSYTWILPDASGVLCDDTALVNPFVAQGFEENDLVKACWLYAPDDVQITPPTTDPEWAFCGIDKENCVFGETISDVMEVAYGTADDHVILGEYSMADLIQLAESLRDDGVISNGATCQNEVFGVEKGKGLCWVRPLP